MASPVRLSLLVLLIISLTAGNVRQGWLTPLATCTTVREFYRIGEVSGCEGWTEAKEHIGAWGFGRKDEKGEWQSVCMYAKSRVDSTGTTRYACSPFAESNIDLNFPEDPYLASIP